MRSDFARDGAGLYNNGRSGVSNPTIINCSFVSNISDLDGGALYNDGRKQGISNPTVSRGMPRRFSMFVVAWKHATSGQLPSSARGAPRSMEKKPRA